VKNEIDMNILVVDDESSYRMLLCGALQAEGWTIFTAKHGHEALQKLSEVQIDLIISDVYMPIMDGIKLHKAVRSKPRYKQIPFIFVSAFDDQYSLAAIKNPRIDVFVQKMKPISLLKEWICYMTTPQSKRPNISPFSLREHE
jgi:CheY-like chemotaxis protein